MKYTTVGVDIAKSVFQLHWVDVETGEIISKQVKRAVFLEQFANREPCLIGMEACGGAQHWARRLIEMGHQVKLMQGKYVKAFVTGNKNDVADARAIWVAVQQSGKTVAVKTEAQQAVLALHRMRQQLVKFRTMQTNCLRGLLTEYGALVHFKREKWLMVRSGLKFIDFIRCQTSKTTSAVIISRKCHSRFRIGRNMTWDCDGAAA